MQGFQNYLKREVIYEPSEIEQVLAEVAVGYTAISKTKKLSYYNIPAAFDIETSSFLNENSQKVAIMYEWTFGINGAVIIGRKWDEFFEMLKKVSAYFELSPQKRLVVYVHNLGYEFQFIRKWLNWIKVFAADERKPITAVCSLGIEFRCSMLLSGYSLEKLGDELRKYKVRKMVGDLDYSLIRHSGTPLTEKELGYCVADVKVVMAYIQERIEEEGNIFDIPSTKTGYVRRYCRNECFYPNGKPVKQCSKKTNYLQLMRAMRITGEDEYRQLKRAFQGGFTHANPFYVGKVLENVASYDFTSSYPTVMCSEMFPMGSAELVQIQSQKHLEDNLKYYCCLFDIHLVGLQSKIYYENYISTSRCWGLKNCVYVNGRIVSADELYTTVTEQDYRIIKKFYTWESSQIYNFRRYRKGYLPQDFVRAILKLYQDKTQLKGVEGKEVEYLKSKGMLNSCYGMAVTDIIREDISYNNEDDLWTVEQPDFIPALINYNQSGNRFLFYPWGVWVTAYARRNLFAGIMEFGEDYVYSDTDSVKVLNYEKHLTFIKKYNDTIKSQLQRAMKVQNLPLDAIEPKTIKGVSKCMGVWDFEGVYEKFKTLGAKRYMIQQDGKINITVSGLNKGVCVPFINEESKGKAFDFFTSDMYIPSEYTGKNTHTYVDEVRRGTITDYLGVEAPYTEYSCVHLSAADYSMGISKEFTDYILNIQDEEII